MRNYVSSDYAANKNAGGIVYRFASETVEITLEDYLRENPDKTQVDFAELKALSDEDYYEADRSSYRQTWKNTSFDTLDEDELLIFAAPSVEEEIIERVEMEAAHTRKASMAVRALDKLTETQRRRYVMYHVHGLTMRQIAEVEGVLHSKIQKSLDGAEKKIKKILLMG
jgi:RNA polymerase sigma factor (sigma-70 family)